MSTENQFTSSAHVNDLLPAYVNGTLESVGRARVEAHVRDCPVCRTDLVAWEVVRAATQRAMPVPPAGLSMLSRLWEAVDAMEGQMHAELKSLPSYGANVNAGSGPLISLPPVQTVSWRRVPVARMATAALVLLVLLASVVAFGGPSRWTTLGGRPAVVPAIVSTPEKALIAGVSEDVTLMQGVFETIPANANWVGIERSTLSPGANWELGTSDNAGEGPWLYRVESGTLTIDADGPITVTRAGTESPVTILPGTDAVLEVGDQGYTPSGVTSRWRNDGDAPVTVMDAGITTIGMGSAPPDIRYSTLVASTLLDPLPVPVAAAVRRLTLDAAAAVPIEAFPGLAVAYVESGQILVADVTAAATPPAMSFQAPYALHSLRPGRVLQNTGQASATILLMTIVAATGPSATPAVESVMTKEILNATLFDVPEGHVQVEIDRWRLRAHPEPALAPAFDGPILLHVADGAVSATVDGISHQLAPGDQLLVRKGQTFSFRTAGADEATMYMVFIAPLVGSDDWTYDTVAYTFDVLLYTSVDALPAGSSDIVFEQLTVPVGATLPEQAVQPLQWIEVGSGELSLTLEGNQLPFRWQSGDAREFHFGQRLPPLSPGTRMLMSNPGELPLILYRLALNPLEPNATPVT